MRNFAHFRTEVEFVQIITMMVEVQAIFTMILYLCHFVLVVVEVVALVDLVILTLARSLVGLEVLEEQGRRELSFEAAGLSLICDKQQSSFLCNVLLAHLHKLLTSWITFSLS